jgi:bifunctional NMN adenylyltransferase/nudix hydrolase
MQTPPYDLGFMIGRFQHIHSGHEHVIDQGLLLCDRVLILVGSAGERGTNRNPFDTATRIEMMREVYPDTNRVLISTLPDLSQPGDLSPEWGRHVLDAIKQQVRVLPDVMLYGDDDNRSIWFKNQREEMKTVAEFIIARAKHPISATIIRQYLWDDNFDVWAKNVHPRLRKHYPRLRTELLQAPGLADAMRMAKPKTVWQPGPTVHPMDAHI